MCASVTHTAEQRAAEQAANTAARSAARAAATDQPLGDLTNRQVFGSPSKTSAQNNSLNCTCLYREEDASEAAQTTTRTAQRLQLQSLVRAGAERLRLIAGHSQVGDSVSRERIAAGQIPKDKDNCGGLADVVEVSSTVTHSCLPQHHSWE